MQQVIGTQKNMHSLDVDKDGAESEDRQEAPMWMIGRKRNAAGSCDQVGGPEVGEVQVVHQGNACHEGASPHKLPVLPRFVTSENSLAIRSDQEDRKPILVEVQVNAILAKSLAHSETAEDIQRYPERQLNVFKSRHRAEVESSSFQPVCSDEMKSDCVLQLVFPLVLLEVHAEVGHLLRPEQVSVPGVSDVIKAQDPVALGLVLPLQDRFPCVVVWIIQGIVKLSCEAAVFYVQLPKGAVEARHQWHIQLPEHNLWNDRLKPIKVRVAVHIIVWRLDVLDLQDILPRHHFRWYVDVGLVPCLVHSQENSAHNRHDGCGVLICKVLWMDTCRPQRHHGHGPSCTLDDAQRPEHHGSNAGVVQGTHLLDVLGNAINGLGEGCGRWVNEDTRALCRIKSAASILRRRPSNEAGC
mmetsp:Transcript_4432/g.10270  ORF Transcript_4432/g.10270 Transcript_4432/m.10270 type:complete len:412 (-) Transcript_4432:61-1296(-)